MQTRVERPMLSAVGEGRIPLTFSHVVTEAPAEIPSSVMIRNLAFYISLR